MWDTGSSKLVVETQHCKNCISQVFETEQSDTFKEVKPQTKGSIKYEDGTELAGFFASDSVCPASHQNFCVSDFPFLALEQQIGLQSNYDGIIGMWSGANGQKEGLLVPYMHQQGLIR